MGNWNGGGGPKWSPGFLDRAETFAESDVTLSLGEASVVNEGLAIGDYPAETDRYYTAAGDTHTATFTFDLTIIDSVVVDDSPSDEPSAVTSVTADGQTLFSGSTSSTTVDTSGISGLTDITVQVENTGSSGGQVGAQIDPDGGPPSATITVQWPMPADVAGWDIIPYDAAPNGGSIDVYAIDVDTGSRLSDSLSDPGDISGVSRTVNVGAEIVISRPSTAENPRLEALYRRCKV